MSTASFIFREKSSLFEKISYLEIYRKYYMSAHLLLNLLKQVWEKGYNVRLAEHVITLSQLAE